jgi:fructose-bisphosphate aldolase class 1
MTSALIIVSILVDIGLGAAAWRKTNKMDIKLDGLSKRMLVLEDKDKE